MKKLVMFSGVLLLAGCSTMQPPRYFVSVDNIQTLKQYDGADAEVTKLNQPSLFDPMCRLMGPIEPADGLTVPAFIVKAFNDELKMADIYSTSGVKISGDITKISFSSFDADSLTEGYWNIELELNSSNGKQMTVNNRYSFKSGFDAITACNATADALTPAVQDLINMVVTHPEFGELLEKG